MTYEQRELARANRALVWGLVNRYAKAMSARYDLPLAQCQEEYLDLAWIGLCEAAERYDPATGNAFSSLAYACIRNQLSRHAHESMVHMGRRRDFWNSPAVQSLSNTAHRTGESGDMQIADRGETDTDEPDDPTKLQEVRVLLSLYLERRRARVLYMYVVDGRTIREIGEAFGFSKQRAQQLLASACEVLRGNETVVKVLVRRIVDRKKREYTRWELGNVARLPSPSR